MCYAQFRWHGIHNLVDLWKRGIFAQSIFRGGDLNARFHGIVNLILRLSAKSQPAPNKVKGEKLNGRVGATALNQLSTIGLNGLIRVTFPASFSRLLDEWPYKLEALYLHLRLSKMYVYSDMCIYVTWSLGERLSWERTGGWRVGWGILRENATTQLLKSNYIDKTFFSPSTVILAVASYVNCSISRLQHVIPIYGHRLLTLWAP